MPGLRCQVFSCRIGLSGMAMGGSTGKCVSSVMCDLAPRAWVGSCVPFVVPLQGAFGRLLSDDVGLCSVNQVLVRLWACCGQPV